LVADEGLKMGVQCNAGGHDNSTMSILLPLTSRNFKIFLWMERMHMIYKDRMTAKMEGDFVVFLIGMRINKPLAVHKYLPVLNAMPKMLTELYTRPELGFIHHEMWFSRTIILTQYWRSMEQLIDYAKNKDSAHLPAWQAFNKAVGTDGSVGIWHETYKASPGTYENVYVNMPAFGLGKAGLLVEAKGHLKSASDRLKG
jgi:hypothetical protein